ncbi:DUF998 domain-containing protein [Salana multivorans]
MTTRQRIATVVAVLAVLQALSVPAELVAGGAYTPSYDWVRGTISDLGVATCGAEIPGLGVLGCSPLHVVVNASLVVSGLALIGLGVLGRRLPGFRGLAGIAWAVAGLSTALTGLVPLDTDVELHLLVSTPVFVASPLGVLLGARQLTGTRRGIGIAVGAVTLVVGAVFLVWVDGAGIGGLLERIALWPSVVWVLAIALRPEPRPEAPTT